MNDVTYPPFVPFGMPKWLGAVLTTSYYDDFCTHEYAHQDSGVVFLIYCYPEGHEPRFKASVCDAGGVADSSAGNVWLYFVESGEDSPHRAIHAIATDPAVWAPDPRPDTWLPDVTDEERRDIFEDFEPLFTWAAELCRREEEAAQAEAKADALVDEAWRARCAALRDEYVTSCFKLEEMRRDVRTQEREIARLAEPVCHLRQKLNEAEIHIRSLALEMVKEQVSVGDTVAYWDVSGWVPVSGSLHPPRPRALVHKVLWNDPLSPDVVVLHRNRRGEMVERKLQHGKYEVIQRIPRENDAT